MNAPIDTIVTNGPMQQDLLMLATQWVKLDIEDAITPELRGL